MPLNVINKPQLTGIIVLFAGVLLLAFTFINAYMFLQEPLSIIATGDLALVFGDALAPLIQACVRLMYLGIMGWIGSLLTLRGIPLVTYKYSYKQTSIPIKQKIPTQITKQEPKKIQQPAQTPKHIETQPIGTEATNIELTADQKKDPQAILIPPENQTEA